MSQPSAGGRGVLVRPAGGEREGGGGDEQVADVGPRPGVAGLKVLVVAHALTGGEGDGFVRPLGGEVEEDNFAGQGLERGGGPGQHLVVVGHVQR